ncbi:MAG: lipoyl(octanoyl) transferase LipB [Armatimonadota bacterium]
MSERRCEVCDLGRVRYELVERLQLQLVAARRAGLAPDRLLLCEHEPVVTAGAASDQAELAGLRARLGAAGIPLRRVSRGGRATWHGPGQIVGYPILDLRAHRPDLHWYLRSLEGAIIDALGAVGYPAQRCDGFTGVWVSGRKVASIGIAVRGWVTYHGFALNLQCDPTVWQLLRPCGLAPEQMASLAALGEVPARASVVAALLDALGRRLRLCMVPAAATELLASVAF